MFAADEEGKIKIFFSCVLKYEHDDADSFISDVGLYLADVIRMTWHF